MRFLKHILIMACGFGLGGADFAHARTKAPDVGLTLHASVAAIAPGDSFDVALKFTLPEDFHIYWENPGDSGMAPVISWSVPAGFDVGKLRFPIPKRYEAGGIVTYILENSPVLLATVTAPKDLKLGSKVTLEADVRWLVCKDACFQQSRRVKIELPVAAQSKPADADGDGLVFRIAKRKMPVTQGKYADVQVNATADRVAKGDRFDLVFNVNIKKGYHAQSNKPLSEFFVPSEVFIKAIPGLQFDDPVWPKAHVRTDPNLGKIAEFTGNLQVRVPGRIVSPTASENVNVSGLLKYQACDVKGRCFPPEGVEWSVTLASSTVRTAESPDTESPDAKSSDAKSPDAVSQGHVDTGEKTAATSVAAAQENTNTDTNGEVAASAESASKTPFSYEVYGAEKGGIGQYLKGLGLLGAIIGGLLGGLILNIMPCVLPVISIKILSFVQQANEKPRRVFHLGLTFCAGIVVSFWFLAGGILLLQSATGATRGWGALFQEPKFVVAMIAVMFAFALNLFGVFEIMLPGAATGKLAGATEGEGFTGAFMKGVLATLLATPCTAPFLAPAISFALAGGPLLVFVIFTSAGVGMAFPYALLTARPAWMKYLPKPGNWMVAFKQLMGFLLIGTAVWLLWILGKLTGESGVVWMVGFLAFLGLACWLLGKVNVMWSASRRYLTYAASLGIVLLGARLSVGSYEPPVHEAHEAPLSVNAAPSDASWEEHIPWIPYASGLAEKLARDGHTVYVDYTASWCLTCQANKKIVLNTDDVKAKMADMGIIPIEADFTNYDPAMAEDLKRFDRDAVPLNVIYPAGKPDRPIVLPVVLTKGTVLDALDKAGPSTATQSTASTASTKRTP